jgi:cytochrome c oxidase assembly protein subunit 11
MKKIKKSFWVKLIAAPIVMFFFAFAMVPLYNVLCDITGFNGTTGITDGEQQYVVNEQNEIEVSFFSMIMPGLPIEVKPKFDSIKIKPGKFYDATYIAKNNTNKEVVGQAVPSVAPTVAASFFKKLECFCFNRQVFAPGDEIEMSVRFVVEPQIDEKIKDISLSYSFFKIE